MSRTYISKSKIEDFDVNVSGCTILGMICKKADFLADYGNLKHNKWHVDPPWEATEEQCLKAAQKFEELPQKEWKTIYHQILDEKLYDGTFENFLVFISEWVFFLKNCKGYYVPR